MPILSSEIVQHGFESTEPRELPAEARYCLRIEFDVGQAEYIPSHDDVIPLLPAGASYNASRIKAGSMPNLGGNAGFTSRRAAVTAPTYTITDVGDEFSQLIASKNVNNTSIYNGILTEWEFGKGEQLFYAREPRFTGLIENHSRPYNDVILECADINRGLEKEIFDPKSWRLNAPISATETEIQITLPVEEVPDNQVIWGHTDRYLSQPGKRGGYCKIATTGEVFFYLLLSVRDNVATFVGVERGVLGTVAAAVSIPEGQEASNRPIINEWIVISETVTDFVRMIATGESAVNDGNGARVMPSSWHAGADPRWIHDVSFAQHSSDFVLSFEGIQKTTAKKFIENELMATQNAILATDGRGRLVWTSRQLPTDTDAGAVVLDESNCELSDNMALEHIATDVRPTLVANYDYNPHSKQFLSPIVYIDSFSQEKFKVDRAEVFEWKGVKSGIHTGSQVRRLMAAAGDEYFDEIVQLTVISHVNDLRVGQLVAVNFPKVIDDTNLGATPLKRSMMIVDWTYNRDTRTTQYILRGSQYQQSRRDAGVQQHNIAESEYRRGKLNIADLTGISISNGIATGNITLQMGRHYYYVDDANPGVGLEFSASLNVTVAGTGPFLGIWVFGEFINKTDIDLTAKSLNQGGTGATRTTNASSGIPGLILNSRSSGRMETNSLHSSSIKENVRVYDELGFEALVNREGFVNEGQFARTPEPALDLNNGILGGIPSDLGGTGGPGGGFSSHHDQGLQPTSQNFIPNIHDNNPPPHQPADIDINGSNGGRGGGGLLVVSWGGGNIGGGRIITSGGSSSAAQEEVIRFNTTLVGARGGGGGPGALMWIVDGNHPPPLLTGADVIALYGDDDTTGTQVSYRQKYRTGGNSGQRFRASEEANPNGNQFDATTRITYTPQAENIQQLFEIDPAEQILDRDIEVRVQGSRPSNGNPHDLWISEEQLRNGGVSPTTFVFLNGAYELVDWRSPFADLYRGALAMARDGGSRFFFSSERPATYSDNDVWLNRSTGVEWTLFNPPLEDQVRRVDGAYVGEELIDDVNFSLSALGQRRWEVSRNGDLQPINSVQRIAQEVANIFITHGLVEGEYVSPGEADGNTGTGTGTGATTQVTGLQIFITGNEVDITGSDYYQIQLSSNNAPVHEGQGPTAGIILESGTYDFINLTKTTAGDASGRVDNVSVGSGSGVVTLSQPPLVTLTAISATEVEVRWSLPSDTSIIQDYAINNTGTLLDHVTSQPYLITGLTPETTYIVGVASRGNNGELSDYNTRTIITPAAGGGTGQIGIQLTDSGRTVIGTAWQNNGGGIIAEGRQISLTLNDGTQLTSNVGANGAFSFTVGAGSDSNLNKTASLYTQNAGDPNVVFAQLTFMYEL